MAMFKKNSGKNYADPAVSQLKELGAQLGNVLASGAIATKSIAHAALATEGYSEGDARNLEMASQELRSTLSSICQDVGMGDVTMAQEEAAVVAGLVAGDPASFFTRQSRKETSTDTYRVMESLGTEDGALDRPVLSTEAYDERNNSNIALNSIRYNLQAARQNQFGETLFPTINQAPDSPGFGVTIRLMTIQNEIVRGVTGALDRFNQKNLLRAYRDATILKNDRTRAVPVYRAAADAAFVDGALVAPRDLVIDEETIKTAPLKASAPVNLIGISQTDATLSKGVMDQTDALDSTLNLMFAYLQFGDDVIRVNTLNLPYSNFIRQPQDQYRQSALNFRTESILINEKTLRQDGSPLVNLKPVVDGKLIVRLGLQLGGSVNIQYGDCNVGALALYVASVQDETGANLSLATGVGKDIVDLVAAGKFIGYEVQAWFANSNHRFRGQLIDTTEFTQMYLVPWRAPVTSLHPVTADGQNDSADINALVQTTRVRTSQAAVTTLLNTAAMLAEFVDVRDEKGEAPDLLGIGRHYVRPYYDYEAIDMSKIVDSIKSYERPQDIAAALVNVLRDKVYNAYRDSEFEAGLESLSGTSDVKPTVIIATDQVISKYLMVNGDLRTMGINFDTQVVCSMDSRMDGKLFVVFGIFGENRNSEVHPMNFGNMAWSPELTFSMPVTRGNTLSRELTVTPRFLHFVNCPVMIAMDITGLPEVAGKVGMNWHEV